jgi:hypothetical protein
MGYLTSYCTPLYNILSHPICSLWSAHIGSKAVAAVEERKDST